MSAVKRCPFCAEEIQDAAIICRHCGRPQRSALVSQVGVVLMFIAGTAFIYSLLFFPTAIASLGNDRRVHNLGLMQDRQIYIGLSIGLGVIAALALWKWPYRVPSPGRRKMGWILSGLVMALWFAFLVYFYMYMEILTS